MRKGHGGRGLASDWIAKDLSKIRFKKCHFDRYFKKTMKLKTYTNWAVKDRQKKQTPQKGSDTKSAVRMFKKAWVVIFSFDWVL